MRGEVRVADDGSVRWSFVSLYVHFVVARYQLTRHKDIWEGAIANGLEVSTPIFSNTSSHRIVSNSCSSAGVQIGAVQSRFGVLGSWTTVIHDGDPVGK